ncbi:MAG: tetratricopeptide repeat protein [Holophagaceae bacterium]|nr:tetratricopeptide repeat protein [Holophagaceae bacterium]
METKYFSTIAAQIFFQLSFCTTIISQEDPRQLFLRAREMQKVNGGNDSAGAVELYRKVVAALPNSSEAQLRLSEALMEIQDIDGALAAAKKATELAPKSAEAATNLAFIEFAIARRPRRSSDAAKAALAHAAKLSPDDPELWFRQADLCESTQDSQGALSAWLHLGRLRPSMTLGDQSVFVVAYERVAIHAYRLNKYNELREACLALAQESSATEQHLQMLEDLARKQIEQGYLGHAEESFAILAKLFPDEPSVWQNIALVQRQADRFEEALQNLAKAQSIDFDPQNSIQQAYCLMNLGRPSEAYVILKDLLSQPIYSEQDDFFEHARSFFSFCLLMLNRPNDLLQVMKSWNDVQENSLLFGQQTQALLQIKDNSSAHAALKRGIRTFPGQFIFRVASAISNDFLEREYSPSQELQNAFQQIHLKISAHLWAEFGQWDKCLEIIKEARDISPVHDFELLLLQSNALESLGQKKEALSVLRLCQQLAPGDSIIQNNLGYHLLENDGDIKEAASLIKAALDQDSGNSSYLDSWGWVLFKQGQFIEAETFFRKAIEANPFSPETLKHLGETLLNLNRHEEALEQWEKALAFAFPDREKLSDRVAKLKTELAIKALEEVEADQDPASDDYDGWQQ